MAVERIRQLPEEDAFLARKLSESSRFTCAQRSVTSWASLLLLLLFRRLRNIQRRNLPRGYIVKMFSVDRVRLHKVFARFPESLICLRDKLNPRESYPILAHTYMTRKHLSWATYTWALLFSRLNRWFMTFLSDYFISSDMYYYCTNSVTTQIIDTIIPRLKADMNCQGIMKLNVIWILCKIISVK